MRKFTILLTFLISVLITDAQSVLTYNFFNTLNELNGDAPALTVLGTQGNFVVDTLNEIGGSNKTVYRFEKNNGVQFNNTAAGNFIGESYTIELYFVFDELSSWKRVCDWKNRKTDWGAYVYNGELNFYNILYSDEAPVVAGEYTYYVITRNAVDKKVLIYTDADVKIDFTDNNGDALIDGDGMLNFFYDDLLVQNEASSGAVAMLKLYNYVLDSTSIRHNWEEIGSNVFGTNDVVAEIHTSVFPNPASDNLQIDMSNIPGKDEVNLIILNLAGQEVYSQKMPEHGNKETISIASLGKGLYLLRLSDGKKSYTSKFLKK